MYNQYPSIYNPITNKPINLYSDEVNYLISQGYDENELFHLPRIQNKSIFTGIADIDKQILLNLPYENLTALVQTNKYGYNLYQNKEFWQDYLNLHFPFLSNVIILPNDITDYSEIYNTFNIIDEAISFLFKKSSKRHVLQVKSQSNVKLTYYLNLFKQLKINFNLTKEGDYVFKERPIEFYSSEKYITFYLFKELNKDYGVYRHLSKAQFAQLFFTLIHNNKINEIMYDYSQQWIHV